MNDKFRNSQVSTRVLNDLSEKLANGKIGRRKFLRGLMAAGLSAPAAMTFMRAMGPSPARAAANVPSFEGVTLTVAQPGGKFGNFAYIEAADWAELSGAELKIVELPGGEMYEKVLAEFATGGSSFDMMLMPYNQSVDLVAGGFVIPLDDYIKSAPLSASYDDGGVEYDSVFPVLRDITNWSVDPRTQEPHVYHVSFDGDNHQGFYRKDWWIAHGDEFAAKYGYELEVDNAYFPDTWAKYYDIAEFFNNREIDGQQVFGHHDINATVASTWHFLWRYTTYLQHGTNEQMRAGDVYFDRNTMEPLINNEAGVRAMTELVEAASEKYSPPNAQSLNWGDLQEYWQSGRLSMGVTWPAMQKIAADPNRSKIPGGMASTGAFIVPGSNEVFNTATNSWENLPEVRRMPTASWGWGWLVASTSKNPDAAYDLIRWLCTDDRRRTVELRQFAEFEIFHEWEFDDAVIAEFYADANPSYFETQRQSMLLAVPDLRIPGQKQLYDSIIIHKGAALEGAKTPKEAVDDIASDWERVIKQRGMDALKAWYQVSTVPHSLM
jgi:multiple sugar transport system substrate-binding protein